MNTKTLPERLRALRAAARPHFNPHNADGTPRPTAFAIVATAERLADLEQAAAALEKRPDAAEMKRRLDYVRDHRANVTGGVLDQLDIVRSELAAEAWSQHPEAPVTLQCPDLTAEEVADIAEQLRGGPAMPLLSGPVSEQFNATVRHYADVTASLEDEGIRSKLIELGWSPPGEAEALTRELVREAALAEMKFCGPGGTIAVLELCRRLKVEL